MKRKTFISCIAPSAPETAGRRLKRASMTLLAALLTATTAWAWDGNGTESDPYQIKSTADLDQLATNVNGGNDYSGQYFVLTKDITYDHTNLGSTESNYEAIGYNDGTNDRYFRGTFDGQNHTVSGIRIYKGGRADADKYQGLFGQISSPAKVKNVILADTRITGYNETGAIVGYNDGGTVTGCHALADVTVHAVQNYVYYHGGIVGYNFGGTVTGCTSAAALTDDNNSLSRVGGIVGYNYVGTVTGCIYLGTTLAGTKSVGAIAGLNYGTVETSYFTDTAIQGKDYNGNTLGNAASAVGYNDGGTVAKSGLAHTVTLGDGITLGATPTGEGRVKAYGDVALSYNDGSTTTIYSMAGSILALACTPPAGYLFDGYTASAGTISGSSLTMPDQDVTITATVSIDPAQFSQDGDTYTINTAGGWNVFCDLLADNAKGYFSGKTVRLDADITVTRMAGGQPFTGTFDGGGHTLTLDYGTADAPVDAQFVAPFVETAADGDHQPTFRNLTIDGTIYATHTQATDHDHVGGLIGHLFGTVTIEQCTSLVEIHAKGGAGGFVGLCEHSVSFTDCHSAAVVRSAGGSNSGFVAWSRSSYWNINFTGCLFDGKLLQQDGTGDSNGGFIGWKGDAKTVNITNCLCAPAPLAAGETMASSGSATFSREHSNYPATITNCYYTAAFDIAQGKATRTVAAGADVTIDGIALTGTVTQYTVSGITAYSGGGLRRGETLYYGSDDQLSLTLTTSAVCPQPGYRYDGYVASAGTFDGTTLTMPDENVTISVNTAGALLSTRQPVTVAFINADGTTGEASAIALDGHETRTSEFGSQFVDLAAGWYYVGTDIDYTGITLRPQGNITLILADGCTMHIGTAENRTGVTGIQRGTCDLTIYGQSLDAAMAGTISYEGTGSKGFNVRNYTQQSGNVSISNSLFTGGSGLEAGSVTLNGGKLSVATNSKNAIAIWTSDGDITINGGQLDATATGSGDIYGLYAGGTNSNITLGWTRPDDRITASSYYATGTVKVADGQALTDGSGNIYTGTLTDLAALGGKTLQPCLALADAADNTDAIDDHASQTLAVALSGRTLYKDGSWNTLCLPFSVSTASGTLSGDNVQAMTLNTTKSNFADGTLTLNFDAATTIPAGTPFIIKWDNTGVNIENPVFEGVTVSNATNDATIAGVLTFTGTYAPVSIADGGDNTKLYLGKQNTLYYPNTAMTIGTHRAYFQLLGDLTAGEPAGGIEQGDDVEDLVRTFVLNFNDGEGTGISSLTPSLSPKGEGSDYWYTLDGRKLDGKPTQRGIYISNGNKIVIK